ncbi:hypothetical protein [Microbacterium sp. SA39]|uniref:hypothetical protein n=1 Tax=Microbacterium sp. SA39 TaxID=1263625 RepID=UPI0006201F4A|nr:hypothetical protein [Microbacterium sp. SA39]KJQ55430.1 hypothetical protein RS85_00708 [Microbacterium sp. SA39]
MTPHHSHLHAAPRLSVLAAGVLAVLLAVSGCSAPPSSREARSPQPSPTPTAPDVFAFDDGTTLTDRSDVSWGDGLVADPGWTSVPSDQPGRWAYVSASGACTASFRGGVLGDAAGMDDREATDALLEYQAGSDFLGAEWVEDGVFRRYGQDDAAVEHRQFSYTFNDLGYLMAARAFVQADYSVWVVVTCEGEPVGPVAQDILSKNFISIDE